MSCKGINLELRPRTSESVNSAYKVLEECSKHYTTVGRSIRTDELSMKTVVTYIPRPGDLARSTGLVCVDLA